MTEHQNSPDTPETEKQQFHVKPVDDLPALQIWQCPNCGQRLFSPVNTPLPDICDFCNDMTTWRLLPDQQ